MIAAAYVHAETGGSTPSTEMRLLGMIDRFGVLAVMGRPVLGAGEMLRMIAAENVVTAYMQRERAENAAVWVAENKEMNELLGYAHRLVYEKE